MSISFDDDHENDSTSNTKLPWKILRGIIMLDYRSRNTTSEVKKEEKATTAKMEMQNWKRS